MLHIKAILLSGVTGSVEEITAVFLYSVLYLFHKFLLSLT